MATTSSSSRRPISTAACLIIGDEVLGGKTVDTNSAYLAKYCFRLGISLKRIITIPDDEADIVSTVQSLSAAYDFVVTSGGIGPTHDDITYQSIGKAFGLGLSLHDEAFSRMKLLSKPHPSQKDFSWDKPSTALTAKKRMVELPLDPNRPDAEQVYFVDDKLWVPLAVVNGNVHILPGVPRLFQQMLEGYESTLRTKLADPSGKGDYRIIISTPLPESEVAEFLTELQKRVDSKGIKVGSYPRWGKKRNTVTLVGKDKAFMDSLVSEVENKVEGKRVGVEGEDDDPADKEPDA